MRRALLTIALLAGGGCVPYVSHWEATLNARGGAPVQDQARGDERKEAAAAVANDDYALELLALENHVCSEAIDALNAEDVIPPARTRITTTTTLIKANGAVYEQHERCEIDGP